MGSDAKIVDPENRYEELPPGEAGELTVRGPQAMKGYRTSKDKTRETIEQGWLHTEDLACMDGKGYFFIAGRQSDMIKYKGYKVLSEDVEDSLHNHPEVLECAVIGIPDRRSGKR